MQTVLLCWEQAYIHAPIIGLLYAKKVNIIVAALLCRKVWIDIIKEVTGHVDRGTKNLLVKQVPEADNILLLKTGAVNFPETNLSVITGDGSLYSFTVNFDPRPLAWVYQLPVQLSASTASYAASLLDNPPTVRRIWDRKWGIEAQVSCIYIKRKCSFLPDQNRKQKHNRLLY